MASDGERRTRAFGGYQPGLDGLRAFAVIGVLLYHSEFEWAEGGYLGVSLFFTLSGFLISSILLDGLRRDETIDLGGFWARRFRRLAPAALVGLLGAVLFGATVATRSQSEGLLGEIVGALFYVANWVFLGAEQSYADLFASPSPVQHYWSLGIEEQFYLVVPVALLLAFTRGIRGYALAAVVGGLALASSVWAWVRFDGGAEFDRLYYGTDTRLAELLVGVVLAVVLDQVELDRVGESVRRAARIAGPVALGVLVWTWSTIELSHDYLWKGGLLLNSALAAAVVLATLSGGPLDRLLSSPPLVWIGRLSYGIYVYHWLIYLWLDEDRTGLDGPALLAVRLAVTAVASIVSYVAIEMPVRRGAGRSRPLPVRLVAYPLAAVIVIVAGAAVISEDGDDPLATIRGEVGDAPEDGDEVLDVLVIAAPDGEPIAAEIIARAADDDTLRVVTADLIGPTGSWAAAVDEHDPDISMLVAGDWPDADADAASLRPVLEAGIDELTSGGAPVLWVAPGADFATVFQRSALPFTAIMRDLDAADAAVNSTLAGALPSPEGLTPAEWAEANADAALIDAHLYRRAARPGPRVMVVGDSQGRSLGYGLERWADANDAAWVWNVGSLGCGIADEGFTFGSGSETAVRDECVGLVDEWRSQVLEFEPDIVVVFSSLWDLSDRRLDDWDARLGIGDPDFDAYLAAEYEDALAAFAATGAEVVWLQPPCVEFDNPSLTPDRLDRLNRELLPALADGDDAVRLFDMDEVLCPDGRPITANDVADPIRGDGIHFSVDGALWFADVYGATLLGMEANR